MIIATFPATSETPAEYTYTDPVRCAECGDRHDDSEEFSSWRYAEVFGSHDDVPFCEGDCLLTAKKRYYRAALIDAAQRLAADFRREVNALLDADVDHDDVFMAAEHPLETADALDAVVAGLIGDTAPVAQAAA